MFFSENLPAGGKRFAIELRRLLHSCLVGVECGEVEHGRQGIGVSEAEYSSALPKRFTVYPLRIGETTQPAHHLSQSVRRVERIRMGISEHLSPQAESLRGIPLRFGPATL